MSRRNKAQWKLIRREQRNQAASPAATGPRTEAGKEITSANATVHGLTSSRVLLRNEDPEAFEAFKHGLELHWNPANFAERLAFDQLVVNTWRLERCRRVEAALLDDCLRSLMEEQPELDADEALARVFTDDVYQKKMRLFLRYQTSIERAVSRVHNQLKAMQKERLKVEVAAAEKIEAAVGPLQAEPMTVPPLAALVERPLEAEGFVSKS